ncbi:MAG: putative ABC transporter permease [Clostridia bacterium]|nr:putative ABC transporter permease [Clostridia bacterium]
MDYKTRTARLTAELQDVVGECRTYVNDRIDRMAGDGNMPDEQYQALRSEALQGLGCLKSTNREIRRQETASALSIDAMETQIKEIDRYRTLDTRNKKLKVPMIPPSPPNAQIDIMERRSNHFAQGMTLWKALLLFCIGSFAGVVLEMLWCIVIHGRFETRAGLVLGPFNLLYGFGAVVLSITLYRVRNFSRVFSFAGGFVVGTVVEFACSWLLEKVFGATSWDYSHLPFNIQGRVCLLYSMFWGALGVLWIKDIYPRLSALILKIPNRLGKTVTVLLVVFLAFDGLLTSAVILRWKNRVDGQPPATRLEAFFDERFPDSRLESTFAGWTFEGEERSLPENDLWYGVIEKNNRD